MRITILVDNPDSWFVSYAKLLRDLLTDESHVVSLVHEHSNITAGDVLFILSCEKLINSFQLSKHTNNIVIHPSDLPKGRGWSPLAWQVLEGNNRIAITLFEAKDGVDSGPVYFKETIKLTGLEINSELKELQGSKTISMALKYIRNFSKMVAKPQSGPVTYYKRRGKDSNVLDVNKPIIDQFNILRISDNERYPAHFYIGGQKYNIKIEKE
jgi:methionyl-tRNA formyltransferase